MCSSSVLLVSLCLLLFLPPCLSSDVTVKSGEDATLPCRGPRDSNITLIKWTKPDLKHYIFFYRENQPQESYQHQSYRGRVELKDPGMKDGDVSVVLKNVNTNDTGRYECLVVNGEGEDRTEQTSNITLKIHVNITAGHNVSLPCRAPSNTGITVVEWTRPGLEQDYVLLYQDGKLNIKNQLLSYQNRVELEDREMKDGDVSMILKEVTSNDTGTYECRVFHNKTERSSGSSSKNEPISTIYLEVYQSGGTEERGDEKGGDKGLQIGLGVGLTLLVVVVGVVGFIIYQRINQRSDRAAYTAARTG